MVDFCAVAGLATQAPNPSRPVARCADGRLLSHADLLARSACWHALFAAQAVLEWGLYLQDPFEFAAALLGAWHAGKTVVLPGDDLAGTVQSLKTAGCALAGDLPEGLKPAGGASASASMPVLAPLDPQQTRLKVFTSGSQGQPQAIDKGLHQLLAEVVTLEASFGAPLQGATVWSTVSHQHIYGLLFYILWPLSSGRPFATQRLLYPEDLAERLDASPWVLVASPAHLKRMGEQLDWSRAHSGGRAVFSSGGPLPFDAGQGAARALGQIPIEVFGSSETGGIAWRQCETENQAWQPFAGVQWREEDGCLAVQSPNLPDANWWLTSDRVQPGADGSFRLLGRNDRIVKIEEKRVSLDAIEQGLLATGLLQEAKALVLAYGVGQRMGVVAVPNAAGQALLQQGRKALGDQLKHALTGSIEAVALPRRWRFVAQLPHNAQGKTTQALLQALFEAGDAMPAVQWLSRSDTQARATLKVEAELPLFRGHFDAAPILPGIAQMDWAISLSKQCFALPPHFLRIEALKFMQPISPGTDLSLELNLKAADAKTCSVSFTWSSADKAGPRRHSSGRVVWTTDAEAAHA